MSAARVLARRYGLTIRFADLGDWTRCELRSEYDARRREIRLNRRVAAALQGERLRRFVEFAIAHELYHHREWIGEVPRLHRASRREAAADAFARALAATR